jgi:hypothetical protein
MAALQVTPELVLVGCDDGNIFVINTELPSFGVFRKRVMRRRLYIMMILCHLDSLVSEVTVVDTCLDQVKIA